jgi:hypothetical protein
MRARQINRHCMECSKPESLCDMHKLFHRLHIPPQEQIILWNMAIKKMNCESFKNILLLLVHVHVWNELKNG